MIGILCECVFIIGLDTRVEYSKMISKQPKITSVPFALQILLDRDSTVDAVAQSSDNHIRFIDAREDVLMTRATRWKDELVSGINE